MNSDLAYLLHSYPYRDSSALLKLFTEQQGLVTAVARGVKKQGSGWRGQLQPFGLLQLQIIGNGDVKTLSALESVGQRALMTDKHLISGLYLNEILLYILTPYQAHPDIFALYQQAVTALASGNLPEPTLRSFELGLLEALGYLPNFLLDNTGAPVQVEASYSLEPEHMPQRAASGIHSAKLFSGAELRLIAAQAWHEPAALKAAKRLLRPWIQYYCKGKPLKSRELLIHKT